MLWGTLDRVLSNRHHPHRGSGQTFVKTSLYPQQPVCILSEFSPRLMSVLLSRGNKWRLERQQGTEFNMNTSDYGECWHWPGQLELISVTPCFIVSLHLVITQASVQGSQGLTAAATQIQHGKLLQTQMTQRSVNYRDQFPLDGTDTPTSHRRNSQVFK